MSNEKTETGGVLSDDVSPSSAQDPLEAARAARLRYVHDDKPGIRREVRDNGFIYFSPDGSEITEDKVLSRINALAIPPAYTDIWICPVANGHIQATARDAKGRKQYRYHERWRTIRDQTKYDRMFAFANALPILRARVESDLNRSGMPREKVIAAIVRLLETTNIRVGNEEYARDNEHYGLTTLKNEHVKVMGGRVNFRFTGKSGKAHDITLRDSRLAKIVARCQDLEGQELFQFVDDEGITHKIHSEDVNEYIHAVAGESFTAKDFRTWSGTILCALCLADFSDFDTDRQAKKNITTAIKQVSQQLGNTPAVCRKCYVHPAILDRYLAGTLVKGLREPTRNQSKLKNEEAAVLSLLHPEVAGV